MRERLHLTGKEVKAGDIIESSSGVLWKKDGGDWVVRVNCSDEWPWGVEWFHKHRADVVFAILREVSNNEWGEVSP